MKKLHEIVVVTKNKSIRMFDGRIMKESDIWQIAKNIERFHPESPNVITHPHFGESKETAQIIKD